MPVTIMAGVNDRFVDSSRHSVRLHDQVPQSDLQLVEGAGHMIHHVAPHEVMAAIDAVAKGVRNKLGDEAHPSARERETHTHSRGRPRSSATAPAQSH
jgi:hypothetical protein